ncbi:MAG: glycosyltransferase family 2 protein [Trichloromonadaceae bacterium]
MTECCAVFVTYNPDLSVLEMAISAIINQVDCIYIIDNASNEPLDDFVARFCSVKGVFLCDNLGIAAGFNVGIEYARNAGYRYLLLLDQDSIPPANMVSRYSVVMENLLSNDQPVAAIGPRYRDYRTGQESRFFQFKWFRNSYKSQSSTSLIEQSDFLISSGSFYSVSVFERIGKFDEKLFIDHVDTEWCHRALNSGFKLFGVPAIVLDHSLGEGSIRFWFFRWRIQPMHKPFRLYYVTRNSLLLYQMAHVPWKWITGDILRLFRLMTMYLIFSPDRIESICWFIRGMIDGVRKVVGPAPNSP